MNLRHRMLAVTGAAILIAAAMPAAYATVGTDQADYSPGSVVTVSGDNSNDAGYLAGETVVVDVSGPNGYHASCTDEADPQGAWTCRVTLWDTLDAVGDYSYVATGQQSDFSEMGVFTDATRPTTISASVAPSSPTTASTLTMTGSLFRQSHPETPYASQTISVSGPYALEGNGSSPTANTCANGDGAVIGTATTVADGTFTRSLGYQGVGTHWFRASFAGSSLNGDTLQATWSCVAVTVSAAPPVVGRSAACSAFNAFKDNSPVGPTLTFSSNPTLYFLQGETLTLVVSPYAGSPGTPTLVELQMPSGTPVGSTSSIPGAITYPIPNSTTALAGSIVVTDGSVLATTACTAAGETPPNAHGPVAGAVDTSGADGDEGGTLTASGVFTDPDGTWLGAITKSGGEGTVTDNGDGTWSWSLLTTDNGSGAVTVRASDGQHTPATVTFSWSAANVAPTGTFTAPTADVNEGSTFQLSITGVVDPSSVDTTAGFEYAFDCGDGYGAFSSASVTTCSTAIDGPDTLYVGGKVRDKDYGTSEYTDTVTVANVAPVVNASISETIDCQTNATLSWSFTDPGAGDGPWAVAIDWGDGTTEPEFNATQPGTQTGVTHLYGLPGTYSVVVTVTDKDAGIGTDDTGNDITVNQTYAVDFLPPFDDSTPSGLIVNKMKNGRVVPVKVTLYDQCRLAFVTDPATSVTIKTSKTSGSGGSSDPVEEYADAGSSSAGTNLFRFSDGKWIYNLDSKALGLVVNNFYRVDVFVGLVMPVKATEGTWGVLQPVK